MAWRYPPHIVAPTRVVEMEDLNENFQVYAEEASGHLNEHNFASGIFTANRTRLAEDVGVRVYRDVQVSDSNAAYPGNNGFRIMSEGNENWYPVSDMSISITSPGSSISISFSAQFDGGTPTNGVMFGLELNGALLPNSVVGGMDLQNDSQSFGINQGYLNNSNIIGLYGERLGICVESVLSLLPGKYTIKPVYFLPLRTVPGGDDLYINNRELLIIETVR